MKSITLPSNVEARLLANSIRVGDCLVVTSRPDSHGYGQMKINGKAYLMHRVAYQLWVGDIPDGLLVRHTCDTPPCIEPSHLLTGTAKENTQDMIDRGRKYFAPLKDSCYRGHRLTEENLYHHSNGSRGCKLCSAERSKNRREKQRAANAGPCTSHGVSKRVDSSGRQYCVDCRSEAGKKTQKAV